MLQLFLGSFLVRSNSNWARSRNGKWRLAVAILEYPQRRLFLASPKGSIEGLQHHRGSSQWKSNPSNHSFHNNIPKAVLIQSLLARGLAKLNRSHVRLWKPYATFLLTSKEASQARGTLDRMAFHSATAKHHLEIREAMRTTCHSSALLPCLANPVWCLHPVSSSRCTPTPTRASLS